MPRIEEESPGHWRVVGGDALTPAPPADSDEALWNEGFIVVVPMRADEVDFEQLVSRRRGEGRFPAF